MNCRNCATKRFKWTVAIALMAIAGAAKAQHNQDPALNIRYSTKTGLASFVTPATGSGRAMPRMMGPRRDQSLAVLRQFGQLFGIRNPDQQLRMRVAWNDAIGQAHTKYDEFHQGVRVFAGVMGVHLNAEGSLVAANGDFFPIPDDFDIQPRLDQESAVTIARRTVEGGAKTTEHVELVIVDPGWYGDPPTGPQLAYYVILSDSKVPMREAFFVGAQSGKIIDRWNLLDSARVRAIYDGENSGNLPGTLARYEGDPAVVPPLPLDANRVYDYAGDVYAFYSMAFGRDSYDDQGSPITYTVNSTAAVCPNAFWSPPLRQVALCDGVVADDIAAHELTHGVINYTANLIYQNQSGQLNESFADVFGELVDLYNGNAAFPGPPSGPSSWPVHSTDYGTDTPNNLRTGCTGPLGQSDGVRWLIGEDADAFGGALRDMWDPTCFGDPDRANSPLQNCEAGDNGGVHFGSGIPNHAFAIVTDGKTFNGQTVTGIGPIKSGAVWYRALTTYLTPGSDFADAYVAFNQAAQDLVGTTPLDPRTGAPSGSAFTADDAAQVDKALLAVEINTDGRCGGTSEILSPAQFPECENRTTIFADDFAGGPNDWSVSVSGPEGPPTSYSWIQTTDIPVGQSGTAWFCADPNIGNCNTVDESARHSLFSPVISLPAGTDHPVLSFTHHVSTEAGWDGGNISISVDGSSSYQFVPSSAFLYNPYNAELNRTSDGSTDPLQGMEGWTGPGGQWGTTLVDLSGFASGGQTIQVRFDMGKDGCVGMGGWYLKHFEVFDCPDCDGSGAADYRDFVFTAASGPLGNIGGGSPESFEFDAPEASGDVSIVVSASADLDSSEEYIDVDLNGAQPERIFESGPTAPCPLVYVPSIAPDRAEISVSAADFNAARFGGKARINLNAPGGQQGVDPVLCYGRSYVSIYVQYAVANPDCNLNSIPDTCENDEDLDGSPDDCDVCPGTIPGIAVDSEGCPPLIPGDFERDGDVDLFNFEFWRNCLRGVDQPIPVGCDPADLSGNGHVELLDYTLFEQCFSSENLAGDPACAD